MRKCGLDGCDQKYRSKGYCGLHYSRLLRHGDPNILLITDRELSPEARLRRTGWTVTSSDCWEWKGNLNTYGYGFFHYRGRNIFTHRLAFKIANGEIQPGMEIDHMCHNRKCCNPSHLRLATPKQNSENLSGPMSNNTSGVRGVYRTKTSWAASVGHAGRRYHVGSFKTLEEAEAAVIAKRNELYTYNIKDRRK